MVLFLAIRRALWWAVASSELREGLLLAGWGRRAWRKKAATKPFSFFKKNFVANARKQGTTEISSYRTPRRSWKGEENAWGRKPPSGSST
jgi:hypothetical protein